MQRRFVVASAMAVAVTAAFLPGSGLGSSGASIRGAKAIPAALMDAIHARLGAGAVRRAALSFPPEMGIAVSLSADGTTALVGAPGAGNGKGAAYIFHVSAAGSWSSIETPTATLAANQTFLFGNSAVLSADGTTAFVGAPFGAAGLTGVVYVFHASAEDAWASSSAPTATLTAGNSDNGVGFAPTGLAVSPDGTTLVVGATHLNYYAGGAYVFHVATEGAWASTSTPTATLRNAAQDSYDGAVGFAVAISKDGTTALVSDQESPDGGGAYIFHVAAADAWTSSTTPTAILSDANSGEYDRLGIDVALSADGTAALLGTLRSNSGAGYADVFHASDEGAWTSTSTPTATLTNADASPGDLFGAAVAMSTDGTTALVTSGFANGRRGAGYIFRASSEATWASSSAPDATLTNSAAKSNDRLGYWGRALSDDGATLLLGAFGVRFGTGATDVFHVTDESSWATTSTPTAILTNSKLNACIVPNLKRKTVRAARPLLKARSCALGKVTRVHHKGKRGRIFFQSPKPGARPPVGTKVAVKVAK